MKLPRLLIVNFWHMGDTSKATLEDVWQIDQQQTTAIQTKVQAVCTNWDQYVKKQWSYSDNLSPWSSREHKLFNTKHSYNVPILLTIHSGHFLFPGTTMALLLQFETGYVIPEIGQSQRA